MPHMARDCFVSSRGATSMPAAVFSTLICSGQVKLSSPLGPFIVTFWPATVAVTPDGTTTGFLPMRDIGWPLEDVTEDFAAHVFLASARIRHHALGRRQDGDAQAVGHGSQIPHRLVDATAGLGHAFDLADRRLAVGVLQLDLELGWGVLAVDAGIAAD